MQRKRNEGSATTTGTGIFVVVLADTLVWPDTLVSICNIQAVKSRFTVTDRDSRSAPCVLSRSVTGGADLPVKMLQIEMFEDRDGRIHPVLWGHKPVFEFSIYPGSAGRFGIPMSTGNDASRVSVRKRGRPSFLVLLNARASNPGHSYLRLRRNCLLPSAPRVRLRSKNVDGREKCPQVSWPSHPTCQSDGRASVTPARTPQPAYGCG